MQLSRLNSGQQYELDHGVATLTEAPQHRRTAAEPSKASAARYRVAVSGNHSDSVRRGGVWQ